MHSKDNMEARKVQRTGKSTFVVSLPKNWATKRAINTGSIIFISQDNNGALVLSTESSEPDLRAKLDIGEKSGEPLIRDIIACYMAGYRTIEVSSGHMSSLQKRDLHRIVDKLIGPEILEETTNKVIIQDLLSSEELQVEQALKRIKNMVRSMIQDALSALIGNDRDLAIDVMQRDNDVDRMNLLIARNFTEILRSRSVKQEASNSIAAFNYMQAASNLERIADHASRIAEVSIQHDCALSEDRTEEFSGLSSIFGNLIDESISGLLHADSEKANLLMDSIGEIKRQSRSMADPLAAKDKQEMLVWLVAASSVERMLDYISNIGELTINFCNANIGK